MNAYKILGVSTNASKSQIKAAFLAKAKLLHPDSSSGNEEKFKELMGAYNLIKDKKVLSEEEHNISYYNIFKKYERPQNAQQKHQAKSKDPDSVFKNGSGGPSILIIATLAILGFSLWGIGDFQTSSLAEELQKDYIKLNGKIEYSLYEECLLNKKKIKY